VCQHVFALKNPSTKIISSNSPTLFQSIPQSSTKIEISVSTLILLSVFIVILLIYIIKTSRS